jgi:hypothetical protein
MDFLKVSRDIQEREDIPESVEGVLYQKRIRKTRPQGILKDLRKSSN